MPLPDVNYYGAPFSPIIGSLFNDPNGGSQPLPPGGDYLLLMAGGDLILSGGGYLLLVGP